MVEILALAICILIALFLLGEAFCSSSQEEQIVVIVEVTYDDYDRVCVQGWDEEQVPLLDGEDELLNPPPTGKELARPGRWLFKE